MSEKVFDSKDLVGSENRHKNKRYSVPASPPKGMMSLLTPRTPLMDVKNRWRSHSRDRMSTGSFVKSTDNRMDVFDEGQLDCASRKVQISKQPDNGEGNGDLENNSSHHARPLTAPNFDNQTEITLHENLNPEPVQGSVEMSACDGTVFETDQSTPSSPVSIDTKTTTPANLSLDLDELSKTFDFQISEETAAVVATGELEDLIGSQEGDIVDPDEVISQLWGLIGKAPRVDQDLTLEFDGVNKSTASGFFIDEAEESSVFSAGEETSVNLSMCGDLAQEMAEMVLKGEITADDLSEEDSDSITTDVPLEGCCGTEYFLTDEPSLMESTLDRSKLIKHDWNMYGENRLITEAAEGLESSLNSSILEHAEAINFFEPSEEVLKFIDEFLKEESTLEELPIDKEQSVHNENDQSLSMKKDDEVDKSFNEQAFGDYGTGEELFLHSGNEEISSNANEITGVEPFTAFEEFIKESKKMSYIKRRSYSTKISRVLGSLREACGTMDPLIESSSHLELSDIPMSYSYSQLLAAESEALSAPEVKPLAEVASDEKPDSISDVMTRIDLPEKENCEEFECPQETPSFLQLQKERKTPEESSSEIEFIQHTTKCDRGLLPVTYDVLDTSKNVSDVEVISCTLTTVIESEESVSSLGIQTLSADKFPELLNADKAASDQFLIDEGNNTESSSDKSEVLSVGRHSDEIKSLESQMLEMRLKVAQLESQVQINPGDVTTAQSTREGGEGLDLSGIESLQVELRKERLAVSDLQQQLEGKKKRVEELEAQLADEQLKYRNLEGQVTEVEKRCSLLEKEHLTAELNFAKELQRMKVEYAQGICKERKALEESSQEVCEEFDEMMSEVERLTVLQDKLKDMLNRVMRTTNESLTGYTKLLKDYSNLHENHTSVKTQLSVVEADNKQLNEDVQVLENLLQRSNDSLAELRGMYVEADESSQAKVESLSSKVSSLTEDLEKATQDKARLETALEDYSDKFQQSLDRLETEYQVSQDELKDTLFLLECQKEMTQTLKEEVVVLRKVKADWEVSKTLIKNLEDSVSFLNEEREATMLEHNSEVEELRNQITMLKEEVDCLVAANREYQNSQDSLQTEVSCVREELYMTQSEVSSLLSSLEQVESRADLVLETLQQKFGVDVSSDSFKATPYHLSIFDTQQPHSLVAKVLSVADGSNSQPTDFGNEQQHSTHSTAKTKQFLRQSNVEYGSSSKRNVSSTQVGQSQSFSVTKSMQSSASSNCSTSKTRKALRFSSPPADRETRVEMAAATNSKQPVESSASNEDDNDDQLNTSTAGFARIRSIPLSGNGCEHGGRGVLSEGSIDLNVFGISENLVSTIEDKFSLILKIAHITDKASRKSIRELRGEVDTLTEKIQMKQRRMERVETELEGKSHSLEKSLDEVNQLNERVNSMIQAILKHEDLAYDVQRLNEDNSELKQEISNLKGEKDMLSAHVQKLIQKANGEDVQISLKRIVALEKKNYDLHCFLSQEKEKNKEKGEKTMRRIRVLETNWKRAEAEVYKFDELVEAIRNTCIESRSVHTHPALLHIRRLIDGLAEVGQKPSNEKDRLSTAASSQSSRRSSTAESSQSTRGSTAEPSQSSRRSTADPSQLFVKSSEREEFCV